MRRLGPKTRLGGLRLPRGVGPRRSSFAPGAGEDAWSPLDLPNLALLVDPATQSLSDGDPIGSYTDPSPNAFSFAQSTSSAKPTWKASGQNSQPYWDCDGGDILIASGLTDPLPHGTGQIWIVHDPGATDWNTLVSVSDTSSDVKWWRFMDPALDDKWGVWVREGGNVVKARETVAETAVHIREWDSDGTNFSTRRDNEVKTVDVFNGADGSWIDDVTGRDSIGLAGLVRSSVSIDFYTGRIYLIALTSAIESAEDTDLMRNYLNDRFALGVSV